MKNLPTLRNDSSFAVQFSISVLKTRAILLFTIKIIEMFKLWISMPRLWSPIGWISSNNPAKICDNYTLLCKCLGNQPIKITTQFSVSEWCQWTALTAGWFRCCWEEKMTQSNWMKFRLLVLQIYRALKRMLYFRKL